MDLTTLVACTIFVISLALIVSEKVHRTIVAVSGAALMVIAGQVLGFYSEAEALEAIDFDTIGLLLGMMLLAALLEPTGFFQYIAVKAGHLSRGKPWRLMGLLFVSTSIISLFLNNITAAVLMAPVTILLSELMGMSSIPYLVAVGFSAVTSGVATSVGDPASVLIASASGYSFNDFLTHSLPVAVVALLLTLLLLRFMFRRELSADKSYHEIFLELDASEVLHDKSTLRRVLIVLGLVIGLFILQDKLKITSAFVALVGASVALLWVQPNISEVLSRVRLTILLFFVGFFVMVGGLDATGTLDTIAQTMIKMSDRPVVLGIVIIWVVAFLSSLVDNVPVTIAMIPVLRGLNQAGVEIEALWWALVFGAVFGGAATVIGSSVNLVIVELSEQTSTPIAVKKWSFWGIPVTVTTCTVASVVFALAFNLLSY